MSVLKLFTRIKSYFLHYLSYFKDKYLNYKEIYWAKQNLSAIEKYWSSRNDESNIFLYNVMDRYNPKSILEIGCNCGNRLYYLSKFIPKADIRGIDINTLAVRKGNEWLQKENIRNVELAEGKVQDIKYICNNKFDIVFSWAVLIYIRPAEIKRVLNIMWSMTNKTLILLEMQGINKKKDPTGLGIYCYPGNWKRDYISLIKEVAENKNIEIKVSEIAKDIWSPGGGGATLVEIIKNPNIHLN